MVLVRRLSSTLKRWVAWCAAKFSVHLRIDRSARLGGSPDLPHAEAPGEAMSRGGASSGGKSMSGTEAWSVRYCPVCRTKTWHADGICERELVDGHAGRRLSSRED